MEEGGDSTRKTLRVSDDVGRMLLRARGRVESIISERVGVQGGIVVDLCSQ